MTTANKVTILRIFLIPFFVGAVLYYVQTGEEWFRIAGLLCFAVASICDGVDGFIARHYNQFSELGTILDPLADKLLLVSGVVVLSFDNTPYLDRMPPWLTITIISRDLVLLIGLAVIHLTVGKVKVRPRIIGKVATVLQMAAVLWILLRWHSNVLDYVVVGAAICTAVSGIWYVFDGMKQLGSHPSSSPTPPDKSKTGGMG
jgi:cardiolipin synthase